MISFRDEMATPKDENRRRIRSLSCPTREPQAPISFTSPIPMPCLSLMRRDNDAQIIIIRKPIRAPAAASAAQGRIGIEGCRNA